MPAKKPARKRLTKRRLTPTKSATSADIQRHVTALLKAALNSLRGYDRLLHSIHASDPDSMQLIKTVRAAAITDSLRIEAALEPPKTHEARGATEWLFGMFAYTDDCSSAVGIRIDPGSSRLKVMHPKKNK